MPRFTRFSVFSTVAILACSLGPGVSAREAASPPGTESARACAAVEDAIPAWEPAGTCPDPRAVTVSRDDGTTEPRSVFSAMRAFKDPETGRLVYRPAGLAGLSMAERRMLSRSTEGLAPRALPGGAVALDLQGRFMTLAVARRSFDGTITAQCAHGSDEESDRHSLPRRAPSGSAAREAHHE